MNTETKPCGYAIYNAPALKKFLAARESGIATKEMLIELSTAAMVEQEEEMKKKPKADLIDFASAKERLK